MRLATVGFRICGSASGLGTISRISFGGSDRVARLVSSQHCGHLTQLLTLISRDPEQNRWFAEHLQPHERMLRAWLVGRFPQLREVDDIIQESYLRVLEARRTTELQSPKAFLFATARNLTLDYFRHERVARTESLADFEQLGVLDEETDIQETVARNQELELLTKAIQSLPERCRQVLTLRKIYGLPQKEIASQLGISEHTVEGQVTIGVRKCAAFLDRYRDRGEQTT
jgi:RNA polymerase sigma factor (sigma-70 family)